MPFLKQKESFSHKKSLNAACERIALLESSRAAEIDGCYLQ